MASSSCGKQATNQKLGMSTWWLLIAALFTTLAAGAVNQDAAHARNLTHATMLTTKDD